MRQLSTHILNILRTHDLIPIGSKVVVAVSGGADSLALLHLLMQFRDELSYNLHIATLDHGLRGQAGVNDVAFVRNLAESWEIACTVGHAQLDPDTAGIEAQAREARYRFLADVAREQDAAIVAVGHHADDQAETLLMNLIRGTGLNGLTGMALDSPIPYATPDVPHLRLIRPLLEITRAEIEVYCAAHNLQPRIDATNADTRYRRNRVRHEIMPILEDMNPQIQTTLGRLASTVALHDDFMREILASQVKDYARVKAGRWTLERDIYTGLHTALRHRWLWLAVSALGVQDSGTVHILHADQVAIEGEVGAIAQFTEGVRLRVDYDMIHIEDSSIPYDVPDNLVLLPEEAEIQIKPHGETPCTGTWGIAVYNTPPDDGYDAAFVLPEAARIMVRTRRAGDRFQPAGLGGQSQKIKKWMIDHKIPAHWRSRIPLLVIDDRVMAIIFRNQWILSESKFIKKNVNENEKYMKKFTLRISL